MHSHFRVDSLGSPYRDDIETQILMLPKLVIVGSPALGTQRPFLLGKISSVNPMFINTGQQVWLRQLRFRILSFTAPVNVCYSSAITMHHDAARPFALSSPSKSIHILPIPVVTSKQQARVVKVSIYFHGHLGNAIRHYAG